MNFLQRLFSQPREEVMAETPVLAGPVVDHSHEDAPTEETRNYLPPGFHIGKISNIGRERERNEDSFFVFEAVLQYEYGQEPFGLFIVADGMGGHQKGEMASSLATRTVANQLLTDVYLPYLSPEKDTSAHKPINEALTAAIKSANLVVQQSVPEGGTTLTTALVMGNNAYIAHIGDSRAYFLAPDHIKQITKDHSLAQRLEEIGQGTPKELANVQNVLYRALGQGAEIEVDTHIQHFPPASSLLLCSDGLWGLVEVEALQEIIQDSATPHEACEKLVAAANEKGGHDNITAIIVTRGIEE
jgi:serine/threonine protein phosphatase PrpC